MQSTAKYPFLTLGDYLSAMDPNPNPELNNDQKHRKTILAILDAALAILNKDSYQDTVVATQRQEDSADSSSTDGHRTQNELLPKDQQSNKDDEEKKWTICGGEGWGGGGNYESK